MSRSRSDLSSVVGNVSDSAPVANFQMEGPSSRKADSVYLNKGCEHESNTSRHDELFTNASLGNSPANSKKSSLLRTIEGDDSKTGKESSGDTFDEDHIVPRQSTDYPEQSSGARVSSFKPSQMPRGLTNLITMTLMAMDMKALWSKEAVMK